MPPIANDRDVQRARESVRAWRESLKPKQQPAPEGLLPPRTAPDTPNVARQYIENSDKLNDQTKQLAVTRHPQTVYTSDNGGVAGYFAGNPFGGAIVSYANDPRTAEHEAVHAMNAKRRGMDWIRPDKTLSRAADVQQLADEGYPWAQQVVDTVGGNSIYANNNRWDNAGEYLAYAAEQNPAEVPPWFRQKHLVPYWSEDALNAQAPPLPDNRASMAPSNEPARPSYMDMRPGPMARTMYEDFADQQRKLYGQEMWSQYQTDNPEWGPKSREEYFNYLRNNDRRYNGLIFGYG